jgi:hypothetical protein
VKIKNIEATEEAKQKIMRDRSKKESTSSVVPVNMAVNFVQHNRCKIFLYLKESLEKKNFVFLSCHSCVYNLGISNFVVEMKRGKEFVYLFLSFHIFCQDKRQNRFI